MMRPPFSQTQLQQKVCAALREDWGARGDITSKAAFAPSVQARARICARTSGVLAGVEFARAAFLLSGRGVVVQRKLKDGARVRRGSVILNVRGPARALLAGERVALNYLGHLSGIATLSARYVKALGAQQVELCCTRKTTPGLRAEEKYAMRAGGASNHRATLSDAVLIKDNHIAIAKAAGDSLSALVRRTRRAEVEIDRLAQIEGALAGGAVWLLLDNMTPRQVAKAVRQIDGRARVEVSGGVTRARLAAFAKAGAHRISTSAPIAQARWLDFGMDVD